MKNDKDHAILTAITETPLTTPVDGTGYVQKDEHGLPRKTSIFTVEKLNERYEMNEQFHKTPLDSTWNYIKKYYKPTPAFFKRQLFKRIPFIDWIRNYNVKEWLLSDIVSGLTIGIVHIPQGKGNDFINELLYEKRGMNRTWICYSRGFTTSDWSICVVFPGDSLRFSWYITAFKYW